jgi:hypothetical protein
MTPRPAGSGCRRRSPPLCRHLRRQSHRSRADEAGDQVDNADLARAGGRCVAARDMVTRPRFIFRYRKI